MIELRNLEKFYDTGAGKTFVAMDLAYSVMTGEPFIGAITYR